MKLNQDCIRDILLYLESNLKLDKYMMHKELINNLTDYSKEDIEYSLLKLDEADFVDMHIVSADNITFYSCVIYDITIQGHNFLDSIRPQSVWEKVKNKSSKLGVSGLNSIFQISTMLISEYIKNSI
ncbi:DUF2513 domain-containing protein [Parvimonas micra]|jgi:hypothetical protein|uniref:DUF2513 domain-containing protein n=1 Tax=Parvimonas micra TaxID=33033 RepID=UPI000E54A1BF|nr:DUF2513 domain-containing protein [Parvimonas micra]AXU11141.1 DUF2513 domain-containing protein [Parvimonas micra]